MKTGKLALRGWLAVAALLLGTSGLACSDPGGVAIDGVADFETAWAAVDSVYPFFEFKGIDWTGVYTRLPPPGRAGRSWQSRRRADRDAGASTRLSS